MQEPEVINAEPMEETIMADEHVLHEGGASCDGNCGGGCDSCGSHEGYCDTCRSPRRFCICLPSHGWVHAEYLLWWQSGMNLPLLVTTSPAGTARAAAGVLPGATVLYGGNNDALDGSIPSRSCSRWKRWLATPIIDASTRLGLTLSCSDSFQIDQPQTADRHG